MLTHALHRKNAPHNEVIHAICRIHRDVPHALPWCVLQEGAREADGCLRCSAGGIRGGPWPGLWRSGECRVTDGHLVRIPAFWYARVLGTRIASQGAAAFLQEAAEQQRQNERTGNPYVSPDAVRGAFRVGRGLSVVFAPESTGMTVSAAGQAQLLSTLAKALDNLPHIDLRGLRIVLGGGKLHVRRPGACDPWRLTVPPAVVELQLMVRTRTRGTYGFGQGIRSQSGQSSSRGQTSTVRVAATSEGRPLPPSSRQEPL